MDKQYLSKEGVDALIYRIQNSMPKTFILPGPTNENNVIADENSMTYVIDDEKIVQSFKTIKTNDFIDVYEIAGIKGFVIPLNLVIKDDNNVYIESQETNNIKVIINISDTERYIQIQFFEPSVNFKVESGGSDWQNDITPNWGITEDWRINSTLNNKGKLGDTITFTSVVWSNQSPTTNADNVENNQCTATIISKGRIKGEKVFVAVGSARYKTPGANVEEYDGPVIFYIKGTQIKAYPLINGWEKICGNLDIPLD